MHTVHIAKRTAPNVVAVSSMTTSRPYLLSWNMHLSVPASLPCLVSDAYTYITALLRPRPWQPARTESLL